MNRSELSLSMMGTWSTTMIRRSCTYGPPLFAPGGGGETIPYAGTPVPGLLHCGDSTFPGIGLPSAAASGMNAANTLVSTRPWSSSRCCRRSRTSASSLALRKVAPAYSQVSSSGFYVVSRMIGLP